MDWLNVHREELTDFEIVQQTVEQYYQGTVSLEATSYIMHKIDWFDIDIEVVFDSFRLPFSASRSNVFCI